MYVVTGATGNTGSVVARTLLERGQKVRVVVRDPRKGADWEERGAEVALARVDDTAAMMAALRGATGAYLMVPPNYASNQVLADQRRVVDAYAAAVEASRPKHVVLLSSIGADVPAGTGPIQTVRDAEERLGRAGAPLTALRAAYFMENWGSVLGVAQAQSILPSTLRRDRPFAMVATEDIGRVAAEALLQGAAAPKVIELAGPEDYTTPQVAQVLSRILGREIQLVDVPDEGIEPALRQAGVTEDLARLYREMIGALNGGRISWRGQPARGKVPLESVLRRMTGAR